MILRKFNLNDYEKLVDLYYDFHKEVYSNREIGAKYFYYKKVIGLINDKYDIIVLYEGDDMIGFTLAKIDHMEGLTEKIYSGDIAYVIPSKRKGRAAYMLYKNVYNYAKEIGLKIVSNGRIENGVSDMIEKHFNATPRYTIFEG